MTIEYDLMFESIQLSIMKKDSEINKEGKAEYLKYATATFKVPEDYYHEDRFNGKKYDVNYLKALLTSMFEDLVSQAPADADFLGIWINKGDHIIENAISLQTLKDIKEYSQENTDSLYEFFKMTLIE